MISLQTLAIVTPITALIVVAGYSWFEYRLIEAERRAEEQEPNPGLYRAAPTDFGSVAGVAPASVDIFGNEPLAAGGPLSDRVTLRRRFKIGNLETALKSSAYRSAAIGSHSTDELLAEVRRLTDQLQNVLSERVPKS